jgi:hypothetical protein
LIQPIMTRNASTAPFPLSSSFCSNLLVNLRLTNKQQSLWGYLRFGLQPRD